MAKDSSTKSAVNKLDPRVLEVRLAEKTLSAHKKGMDKIHPVLDILGNRRRLEVLLLLNEHTKLCVTSLCDAMNMSAPALSQHLRKMREAKVVSTKKDHKTVYYSLKKGNEEMLETVFKLIK